MSGTKIERRGRSFVGGADSGGKSSMNRLDHGLEDRHRLLAAINRAQSLFIQEMEIGAALEGLLDDILPLTRSGCGFFAEIDVSNDGVPSLCFRAMSDVAWDERMRTWHAAKGRAGNEFHPLENNLFRSALSTGSPVFAGPSGNVPLSEGLPCGLSPFRTCLAIPLEAKGEVVGLLGLANRPGGYDDSDLSFLHPLIVSIGQLLGAMRSEMTRRSAENTLRRMHEGFRKAQSVGRIGGWEIDSAQSQPIISAEAYSIFGTAPDPSQSAFRALLDRVHRDDRAKIEQSWQQALSGAPYDITYRIVREGEVRWVREMAEFEVDGKGALLRAIGAVQDVTDSKRTEESLRQSLTQERAARERLFSLFKSVADGVIAVNADGRITLMNPAAEALTGVRLEKAAHRSLGELLKNPEFTCACEAVLTGAECSAIVDFSLQSTRRKEPCTVQARLFPVAARGGRPKGLIAILCDMRKERELDRLKSEFIAMAAHELRSTLTAILGYASLLHDARQFENFSPDERMEFLGQIVEKGEMLDGIVDDFLDLNCIEYGVSLQLEKSPCDLSRLFDNAVDHYRRQSSDHVFETALSHPEIKIFADRRRLGQVLENLLSNSVKYSPSGGTIRLEGRLTPRRVEISVSDEGIGMSPEQVAKVFDKFYRADESSRAVNGLGLGMSIVKEIVEGHGGEIDVRSEPARGTTVTFTLPLTEEMPEMSADAALGALDFAARSDSFSS